MGMDFETYVAAIQKLAEACGATEVGVPYCEAEAWRDSYDNGIPHSEAWSAEVSAASEM